MQDLFTMKKLDNVPKIVLKDLNIAMILNSAFHNASGLLFMLKQLINANATNNSSSSMVFVWKKLQLIQIVLLQPQSGMKKKKNVKDALKKSLFILKESVIVVLQINQFSKMKNAKVALLKLH